MTKLEPTERDRYVYYLIRIASFMMWLLLWLGMAALVRYGPAMPIEVIVSVALGTTVLALTPLAPLLSVFTLWSGLYVSSCPYCMVVHLEKLEPERLRCDSCDHEAILALPVYGEGGWVFCDDEHYCSTECAQ